MEEPVTFSSDGLKIKGNLHLPSAKSPCVVALHGLLGDKDKGKWPIVASELCEAGFSCLRFNFRGCGEGEEKSEGKFENLTLSARIKDYRAALDFISNVEKVDMDRIGSLGASLGGMVAIASKEKRARALVTMGSPYKIPRYEEPRIPERRGDYYVLPSGERFKVNFYEDMKNYDLGQDIAEAPPILILQGDSDDIVPIEHARKLYERAKEPKRLEIIRGADHAFSKREALDEANRLSIEWFNKYL